MSTKVLTWSERRERRAEMAAAVRSGGQIGLVAGRYGVSIESVRRACAEHGVRASLKSGVTPATAESLAAPAA